MFGHYTTICECCEKPCQPMTVRFEAGESILYGHPHCTIDSYIVSGCCDWKVRSEFIERKDLQVTVTCA